MNKKLLLIDGNSIVYRAYYGIANSKVGVIKNSNGIPINSVLVFAKMINSFLLKYKPTHLLVAFDAGRKTSRHQEYPQYKANRPPMPEDLRTQLPLIKEMLDLMKIKHFEREGIEADDIIGSIAKNTNQDTKVFIMSSDKDLFQLIDNQVSIIYPQSGSKPDLIYDPISFVAKWGYKPSQVIDIKGLEGDKSDNLPGVQGIGNKGAVNLVQKYSNLETIYKNINEIKESTRNKLVTDEKNARMSKKLATIITELNLGINFENMEWFSNQINKTLFTFFERIQTRSLIKTFERFIIRPKTSDKIIF